MFIVHAYHYYCTLCCTFHILATPSSGESTSDSLEAWLIALIIVLPLVAVVIMLSIGIYCACWRKSHNLEMEMGPVANMNNKDYTQVHHNQ